MYKTWKNLEIKNEAELKSAERIANLAKDRGTKAIPIAVFAFFAVASLLLAVVVFATAFKGKVDGEMIGFSIGLFIMAIFFSVGTKLFMRERDLDHLLQFGKNPQDFEFVEGQLESYTYGAREGSNRGRITAQGKAFTKEGKELFVLEFFSPDIWNFVEASEDESLQEGDDWYDMKGKRPRLPLPAFFLCEKKNPKVATLVAVRYEDLKNKKGS